MTELKAAKGHGHPALDIGGQEDERPIFDNVLSPESKIEVGLTGEDIYRLWTRRGHGIGSPAPEHSRVLTRPAANENEILHLL